MYKEYNVILEDGKVSVGIQVEIFGKKNKKRS